MDFGTDQYKPISFPNYNTINTINKEITYRAPSIIDIPIKSGFLDKDINDFVDVLFYIIVIYIVLTLIDIKKEMEKHSAYLENIMKNKKI